LRIFWASLVILAECSSHCIETSAFGIFSALKLILIWNLNKRCHHQSKSAHKTVRQIDAAIKYKQQSQTEVQQTLVDLRAISERIRLRQQQLKEEVPRSESLSNEDENNN
jgi:hypothetical protein